MNAALDALTAYEVAGIRSTVGALVEDAQLGAVSVTHYARGARAYQPGAGTVDYAETATSLTALISPLTEREVAATAGAKRGDVTILITLAALATPPAVDDRIVTAAGTTYTLLDVERIGAATHYRAHGRKA